MTDLLNQVGLAFRGSAQVLLMSVLLGAGLPVIFALGMRSLAFGQGGTTEVGVDTKPHPVGRILAGLCFAVVIASILLGIAWVVGTGMGYKLSFERIYPTFTR